jgi:hypothetical protein
MVAAGVACAPALAQWSDDPLAPTPVIVATADQAVPVVTTSGDGSTWVAYADNGGSLVSGYKHTLQRLDAGGNATLTTPLVLSPTRTSTAVFTFDADSYPDGSAVIAYDNGEIQVQKVSAAGVPLWGPGGAAGARGVSIPLSNGALGPQVAAMEDGGAVVSWASGSTLFFQRIGADGLPSTSWTVVEAGRALSPSDLIGTPGGVIAMWVRAEGTNFVTSRKGLKIQRYLFSGFPTWNFGVPFDVYASSATPARSIQNGYQPRLVADGAGGAIVAWYDIGQTRTALLQHYSVTGVARFPVNGLVVDTSTSEIRLSASVAYHPALDEYTVVYQRSNLNQSQFGLGAQRVNAAGARLWNGGTTVSIVDLQPNPISFATAQPAGNDAVSAWLAFGGTNGPQEVRATRLASATGAPVWASAITDVTTTSTSKGRLALVPSGGSDEWFVGVWSDGSAGNSDIRAARINGDGTIGPGPVTCPACVADFDGDGGVTPGDVGAFFAVFEGGEACADVDEDGGLTPADVAEFFTRFESGEC